jgi:hypothetical protein
MPRLPVGWPCPQTIMRSPAERVDQVGLPAVIAMSRDGSPRTRPATQYDLVVSMRAKYRPRSHTG